MGWEPILDPTRIGKSRYEGASLGIVLWRGRPKLSIGIEVKRLRPGWGVGTRVSAFMGRENDFRKLRLVKDDEAPFRLAAIGGPGSSKRCVKLWLPLPNGVEPTARRGQQVPIARADEGDAMIIFLPSWAIPKVRPAVDVSSSLMGDPKPGRRA